MKNTKVKLHILVDNFLSNFKFNLPENGAFIPLHLADNLLTAFPLKICLNKLHLYLLQQWNEMSS